MAIPGGSTRQLQTLDISINHWKNINPGCGLKSLIDTFSLIKKAAAPKLRMEASDLEETTEDNSEVFF